MTKKKIMITKIIKQLWNERRGNAWLFVELVIVSVFLWQAIDPLYTYTCILQIPNGCKYEGLLTASATFPNESALRNAYDNTSYQALRNDILQIYNGIAALPQIETIVDAPLAPMHSSMGKEYNIEAQYTLDGKEKRVQLWRYAGGSNYSEVFHITDYFTGKVMSPLTNPSDVYISYTGAMEAFGTTDCIDKRIGNIDWTTQNTTFYYTIKGVYNDTRESLYGLPIASIIAYYPKSDISTEFVFRLKEGTDRDEFIKYFNENIAGKKLGNIHICSEVAQYEATVAYNVETERNNHYFQLFLSFFALFCAFLGITSTFWIRSSARRGDIGIMRSGGASRRRIIGQFVTEGLLLVTTAFAVALPLIVHLVASNDFAQPLTATNEELAAYSNMFAPLPRFAVITAATYFIIAATAVIAAVIPAAKACNTDISDALRE